MFEVPENRDGLTGSWRRRFEILDRIDGAYFTRWRELSTAERVTAGWAWPAFPFSFLYYFAKGMWEKGLLLMTAYAVLGMALGAVGLPDALAWFGVGGVCAAFATSDYYKRVEHDQRIWPWLATRLPAFLRSTPALAVVGVAALGCHVAIAVQA